METTRVSIADTLSAIPLAGGADGIVPTNTGAVGHTDVVRGPGPRVMAADTLQGDEVRNAADEKLGQLIHIMIDVPSGRVAYGVLSVGGFMGVGDKLFAIPWKALRLDPQQECFRLNVSKERLEKAEGFDKESWPAMADPAWAERLHDYYEVEPYWSDATIRR